MKSRRPRLGAPRLKLGLFALAAAAVLAALGCKSQSSSAPAEATSTSGSGTDDTLTVGFIYVGPKDDYGYNQAHHEGALVLSKLPGIKIREEENVPETDAVQKTMESMISLDGAKLLFPTSFGYFDPHILVMAKKFPDVTFFHCGGLYDAAVLLAPERHAVGPADAGAHEQLHRAGDGAGIALGVLAERDRVVR